MSIKVQGTEIITDSLRIENVDINYDNSVSGLLSNDFQGAIDELTGIDATPIGTIQYFAKNSAPFGWLKANGAEVSRTTYIDLFNQIGTTFGSGDGSTTFNLPDIRGETIRVWDDGRGVDSGRNFGSIQGDAFSSHTHGVSHNADRWWGNRGTRDWNGSRNTSNGIGHKNTSVNTNSTGGDETRPRNVALLPCIKF